MPEARILMGVIGRPHGVRGLSHVVAYAGDLSAYASFDDGAGGRIALRHIRDDVHEIARIVAGRRVPITDRDDATRLTNTRLYVARVDMPPPEPDEYYLADLVGLHARHADGRPLGQVRAVHDYGAGASLEIAADDAAVPLLVPFTRAAVPDVNVAAGTVTVAPPTERMAPP